MVRSFKKEFMYYWKTILSKPWGSNETGTNLAKKKKQVVVNQVGTTINFVGLLKRVKKHVKSWDKFGEITHFQGEAYACA